MNEQDLLEKIAPILCDENLDLEAEELRQIIDALREENERLRSDKRELVEACEKVICAQTIKEIYDVLYSAVAKHREG